ncbi:MAG: hypothetical protein A3E23_22640 [Burkholderiales bacterium RIFCSPHIGHO2_12_FULL_65_48]|nr:MAG: hypothetical protein A3C40_24220 [Burkholderiales bacterium RIFCSPHIGHO2_02_FULL_64_19]OGB22350.1 MAG: hypothetical protein A3E23_22640 [Burkholderiales bacterium RIFCSPHIGHO2_12_FULL_65_48]OGB53411.1 MAG: hypothetical protein A3F71_09655 [Burkholderiales bacterium RIFCSPLOWO2_12_FULL_64_33]
MDHTEFVRTFGRMRGCAVGQELRYLPSVVWADYLTWLVSTQDADVVQPCLVEAGKLAFRYADRDS